MDGIRLAVLFSGSVQGVGFRYTTRSIARDFAVSGYVRNLPDGRVELIAEGAADETRAFLAAVQHEMGGHIREARVNEEPPGGGFSGFEIRY